MIISTLVSPKSAESQIVIKRLDKVIFFNSNPLLEVQRESIAKDVNQYIKDYCSNCDLPYILLDIGLSEDSTQYQLGYDNIYGSSVYNDIYRPEAWDYTTLGIRINVYNKGTTIDRNAVIILLDYALRHTSELMAMRTDAIKKDFYDRPNNITLEYPELKKKVDAKQSPELTMWLNNRKPLVMLTSASQE